jgi:hypothetical protein
VEEREEWEQKSERKEAAIGARVKSIKTKRLAKGSPTIAKAGTAARHHRQRGYNDIFLGHMKLSYVEIKSYRSIQALSLKLDPKCRILVGINESGKTNILNAMNLLDPKEVATRRDLREPGLHEAQIIEAHIGFIFSFEKE